MEAFVAVAKAQGDESQISSGNSLVDSASSAFNTSCRTTNAAAEGKRWTMGDNITGNT